MLGAAAPMAGAPPETDGRNSGVVRAAVGGGASCIGVGARAAAGAGWDAGFAGSFFAVPVTFGGSYFLASFFASGF